MAGGFGGPPRPMGPPSAGATGGVQEQLAGLQHQQDTAEWQQRKRHELHLWCNIEASAAYIVQTYHATASRCPQPMQLPELFHAGTAMAP
jgi:hypothetical protein